MSAPVRTVAPAPAPGRSRVVRTGLRVLQPGVLPLRPLTVGETLDAAVAALRAEPRTVLVVSSFVTVPLGLLQVGATALTATSVRTSSGGSSGASTSLSLVETVGSSALHGLGLALLVALLTPLLGRAALGNRTDLAGAWKDARQVGPRGLGVAVLAVLTWASPLVLTVLLGLASVGFLFLLLLVVPVSAWLWTEVQLGPAAAALEGARVGKAYGRGWFLGRAGFFRVFGVLLLALLVRLVLQYSLTVPLQLLLQGGQFFDLLLGRSSTVTTSPVTQVLVQLASSVADVVLTPFAALTTAVLYLDVRMRKEGLDVALQTASRAGRST